MDPLSNRCRMGIELSQNAVLFRNHLIHSYYLSEENLPMF